MSEFKGTKGSWCFKRKDDDTDNGGLYNLEGNLVCHFGDSEQYYPTDGTPPDEDDMALITAAPDLLKELQKLRAYVIDVCGVAEEDCHAEHPLMSSKSAITKALGETK